MKLDKAIELNKEARLSLIKGKFHDHADAVQLGIESMTWHRNHVGEVYDGIVLPLPGETED
ncbi:unnamed protein product [marine sediment metagenome]|uniref:Uncharacterized protein n=1 Tax=marine sediment metagenome TaxID=412755 RepID=X1P3A1_9ZZZZ